MVQRDEVVVVLWSVMRSPKHNLISNTVIRAKLGKLTRSICECNEMIKHDSELFLPENNNYTGGRSQPIKPIKREHSQTSPTITDSVISIIPAECLPL